MYLVIIMACCRLRQDMRIINFEFFGRITRELRMPDRMLVPLPRDLLLNSVC